MKVQVRTKKRNSENPDGLNNLKPIMVEEITKGTIQSYLEVNHFNSVNGRAVVAIILTEDNKLITAKLEEIEVLGENNGK